MVDRRGKKPKGVVGQSEIKDSRNPLPTPRSKGQLSKKGYRLLESKAEAVG